MSYLLWALIVYQTSFLSQTSIFSVTKSGTARWKIGKTFTFATLNALPHRGQNISSPGGTRPRHNVTVYGCVITVLLQYRFTTMLYRGNSHDITVCGRNVEVALPFTVVLWRMGRRGNQIVQCVWRQSWLNSSTFLCMFFNSTFKQEICFIHCICFLQWCMKIGMFHF